MTAGPALVVFLSAARGIFYVFVFLFHFNDQFSKFRELLFVNIFSYRMLLFVFNRFPLQLSTLLDRFRVVS